MTRTTDTSPDGVSRRRLLVSTGLAFASGAASTLVNACAPRTTASAQSAAGASQPVRLPRLFAASETEHEDMPAPLPPEQRVGFAVVGLGRLALDEILPAFGQSKKSRLAALVSGDAAKAATVARQYGVKASSVYSYETYDRLRDDPAVQVVYIVLPNGLHAEYTVRAAAAGKHVLCEKPMANTVAECDAMIDACHRAKKRLMIAYRMQYEPYNREIIRMARAGELGKLQAFVATNGQNQGAVNQWRLKRTLAGGGSLPDVGIYCLNAARYLSGEEPISIQAMQYSAPGDPRFTEVEETVHFTLRFPSGFLASCSTSYGVHDAKSYRLMGETARVDLNPAFPYRGQQMRVGRKHGEGPETAEEPHIEAKNQFALELDHMAACILDDRQPHTPGEEGRQDMRLIASIYEAARTGATVTLPPVSGLDAFRGPPPV